MTHAPVAISVENLAVAYVRKGRILPVLQDISFSVRPGEALAIVGESGCGKSTLAASILGVLPGNAQITYGTIRVAGLDTTTAGFEELRAVRGTKIAMVSQEPGGALNPSMTIGKQVAEAVLATRGCSATEARARALELLTRVAIREPQNVARRYPHQLSGGQQQRVLIAMAVAGDPSVLVLDEPTTGLDATVEAEVVELIGRLRRETGAAIIFISHNLRLVSRVCERMAIFYAGRLIEIGPSAEVIANTAHPYTNALLSCLPSPSHDKFANPVAPIQGEVPRPGELPPGCVFSPRCRFATDACTSAQPSLEAVEGTADHRAACYYPEKAEGSVTSIPIERGPASADDDYVLELEHISKRFRNLVVCDDISFKIKRGETLGLVGESGSGKSTLARCIAGLTLPDSGIIRLNGKDLSLRIERRSMASVRAVQMVFQSPENTLNPSFSVRAILGRAISRLAQKAVSPDRLEKLAENVRLPQVFLDRRPRQLSGGQKQRVAIARAFAGQPELVLCDEPVSALDTSVQAGILYLLTRLQNEERVSYLFISHDLGVVRYLADRIGVMYLGQMLEIGTSADIFAGPRHPYADALLRASSLDGGETSPLPAAMPDAQVTEQSCRFAARCPRAMATCISAPPPVREGENGHQIRCHLTLEQLCHPGTPTPVSIEA
ncbi:ABC transporter ATP-binding protein [Devosia sp. XJ19-1]|uniref:ABC transporter ATP-binding protein n=1 Tax=Devosia ureilytica TaxID=2952754 RepID=A0A9Q4FU75_9HYPH|nr:ABC transporter ATP-binding protein [Devosia ureilytica]MCP8884723.1 ABC transporter ATP-binding protein [Devosia ureilytica]MCP8888354.1 ABC transporter ATP-binding protein [Devosia ureilytica]